MSDGGFNVLIDSTWWQDCNTYIGNAVEEQCRALKHNVLKPKPGLDLKSAVAKASLIVVDLVRNGGHVQELLGAVKEIKVNKTPLYVVGVSTFLSWNKSNSSSLKETDYKTRECSFKYKAIKTLEDEILACAQSSEESTISPCIVAPGVLYGNGEDKSPEGLFSYFRDAFLCKPVQFLESKGVLPSLHVMDLAKILFHIQSEFPESPYILATDSSKGDSKKIAEEVSKILGSGETKQLPLDSIDALTGKWGNLEAAMFNKPIELGYVNGLEAKGMKWECKDGLAVNAGRVCKEYTSVNGLYPTIKVFIHGRPGAGKTFLAKKLAEKYKILIVDTKEIIEDAMSKDEEIKAKVEAARAAAKKAKAPDAETMVPTEVSVDIIKKTLSTPHFRNKGFVLDGFPTTHEAAEALFTVQSDSKDDSKDENGSGVVDQPQTPNVIIDLHVSVEQAEKRIHSIPVDKVIAAYNDEEGFKARTEEFEKLQDDVTKNPLEYFRKSSTILELGFEEKSDVPDSVSRYIDKKFKPKDLSTGEEESYAAMTKRESKILETKNKAEADAKQKAEEVVKKKEETEKEDAERRKQLLLEEQALVENYSMPLRKYLMKNVVPPITKGLLQVCKVQPEDPVDFLAEYLFKYASANKKSTADNVESEKKNDDESEKKVEEEVKEEGKTTS